MSRLEVKIKTRMGEDGEVRYELGESDQIAPQYLYIEIISYADPKNDRMGLYMKNKYGFLGELLEREYRLTKKNRNEEGSAIMFHYSASINYLGGNLLEFIVSKGNISVYKDDFGVLTSLESREMDNTDIEIFSREMQKVAESLYNILGLPKAPARAMIVNHYYNMWKDINTQSVEDLLV